MLCDFWLCYSCSGTLVHDSRSYSDWVLSLSVYCVCMLCICQCFFAVINRCQRIFIRVLFLSLLFVLFAFVHSRLAARSHSFANSLSLSHSPSSSISFCRIRVFARIARFLPWRRQWRQRAVVVCHWLPNLYTTHRIQHTHTHLRAPFSFLR